MMSDVPSSQLGQKLFYPSSDGISNLCFSNYSNNLLVASWDAKVRLYDASTNVLKGHFGHNSAVLDCCFHNDSSGFSACIDNTVCRYDFHTSKKDQMGCHNAPVSCVEYSQTTELVISGSWDKTVKYWDHRSATRVGSCQQINRVCSMSLTEDRLVVATQGLNIIVYDLRKLQQSEQIYESSLQNETRCVRCFPNGTGYALSSVDGHVAFKFFNKSETSQAKKYKFRSKSVEGQDTIYSINAIAFHPIYNRLATGCFGGYVKVWDLNNKKWIHEFLQYPTSIASLSYNRDGSLLAIASSYTHEEGDTPHELDDVFVRSIDG